MNTAEASVILERAMLRLANAAQQERKVVNQKLTGRAIAINMTDNLLNIAWDADAKQPEVTSKKFLKYLH